MFHSVPNIHFLRGILDATYYYSRKTRIEIVFRAMHQPTLEMVQNFFGGTIEASPPYRHLVLRKISSILMLMKVLDGVSIRGDLREILNGYRKPPYMNILEELQPYPVDSILLSPNEGYSYGVIQGCFDDGRTLDPRMVHIYNRHIDGANTIENVLIIHDIEYHKEYGRIFIDHIPKLKEIQRLFRPDVTSWFEDSLVENIFTNPEYKKCHERNVLKHECHISIYQRMNYRKHEVITSIEQLNLLQCGHERGFFDQFPQGKGIDDMYFIGQRRNSIYIPQIHKSYRVLQTDEQEYLEGLFSRLHSSSSGCRLPYIMCLLKRKYRHLNQIFDKGHLQQYELVWKKKKSMEDTTYNCT
jgi:hypothetical protein